MLDKLEMGIVRARRYAVRMVAVVALAVVATVVASPRAEAQRQVSMAEAEQLCTPDVFRLCNAYIPDRGKITACLRANRRALSAGCQQVFAPQRATRVAKRGGKATKRRVAKRRR
jgi:hypothetical protein